MKRKIKNNNKQDFIREVRILAKKYNLPFFIITDGASAIDNNGCEAVKIARRNHIAWELQNNIDYKHN